jgi:hypothetical protein
MALPRQYDRVSPRPVELDPPPGKAGVPADLVRLRQDVQDAPRRLRKAARNITPCVWRAEQSKQLLHTLVDKEPRVTLPGVVGGRFRPRGCKIGARDPLSPRQRKDPLVRLVVVGEQVTGGSVTLGHAPSLDSLSSAASPRRPDDSNRAARLRSRVDTCQGAK